MITVNQVGYPLGERKVAIFTQEGLFHVIDHQKDEVVYTGKTGASIVDEASGQTVFPGEFSQLNQTGLFIVKQGEVKSHPFSISEQPYIELQRSVFKAFYYYRCGMELTEEYAGPWNHKSCHLKEGIVYDEPSRKHNCSGGWHDAGDYGKYTVAGAKAVADLLLAYEFYPDAFKKPIPLPETDGITPDVLHECRYELDWLLKMQDSKTGGVFHKLTTKNFPGLNVMPENDLGDLYFLPISATATGAFAAIMAMAARVYQKYDTSFATACLEAAENAWNWLEEHPNEKGFKNPSDIYTGEYGDEVYLDERYWAAAELFRTTSEPLYHEAFKGLLLEPFPKYSLGWVDVGGYGTIAYLLTGMDNVDLSKYNSLKDGLMKEAQNLLEIATKDGYLVSMKLEDYVWGSNMVLMNNSMLMLIANYFEPSSSLLESALDHVHYLMGRNVMDYSYVTGFGMRPIMNLHHRPSVGDDVDDPVPGLVSGGPDRGLHDPCAKENLQGKPPAQCFIDDIESYSTNEVTIYWNSPAVFVLSHFAN